MRECAFWKRFLPQLGKGKFDGRYGDFFYHIGPNNNLGYPENRPGSGKNY